MKNGKRLNKKIFWASLAVLWPAAAALGQSQQDSSQASPQAQEQKKPDADAAKKPEKEKTKPKKVYTEEDLSGMRGNGVSVVGDEKPQDSGAAGTKKTDGKPKTGVTPMSGQDEEYWRGKARAILDEITATEQEIAKTKDEIKKYGGDGFDATTGLKDNIIYIDNRNSKVQQLEKHKADLEKKLDQLSEEGRKAGAAPSWFR
jgi:peptidoglycan hydrolase CwlO-like protein